MHSPFMVLDDDIVARPRIISNNDWNRGGGADTGEEGERDLSFQTGRPASRVLGPRSSAWLAALFSAQAGAS